MTRVPVGRSKRSFEAFSSNGYVFPLIGGVVGGVMSLIVLGLVRLGVPPDVGGFVYVAALIGVQGINHSDGLADFADGLAAHGSEDERRDAMKDLNTGIGGTVAVGVAVLGLYATSSSLMSLSPTLAVTVVFVSEIAAKTGISLEVCLGKASHEGHGSRHIESTPQWHFLVSLFLAFGLVAVLPEQVVGITILGFGVATAVLLIRVSRQNFGGVSGDVFGATNEVVRLTSLVAGVLVSTVL